VRPIDGPRRRGDYRRTIPAAQGAIPDRRSYNSIPCGMASFTDLIPTTRHRRRLRIHHGGTRSLSLSLSLLSPLCHRWCSTFLLRRQIKGGEAIDEGGRGISLYGRNPRPGQGIGGVCWSPPCLGAGRRSRTCGPCTGDGVHGS
jgi:hypothetical protein